MYYFIFLNKVHHMSKKLFRYDVVRRKGHKEKLLVTILKLDCTGMFYPFYRTAFINLFNFRESPKKSF